MEIKTKKLQTLTVKFSDEDMEAIERVADIVTEILETMSSELTIEPKDASITASGGETMEYKDLNNSWDILEVLKFSYELTIKEE